MDQTIEKKVSLYKYKISVSILLKEEIIILKTEQISLLSIDNDYINNYFPVLKLTLVLSASQKKKIQEEANTVRFKISLQKNAYKDDRQPDNGEPITNFNIFGEDVFTDMVFRPIDVDCSPNPREALENSDEKDEVEQNLKSDFFNENMEFFLFNEEHLRQNKIPINAVLQSADIKNAVGYILNKTECDAVILDNPDNVSSYQQIIIPPLNRRSGLKYLQNVYGIYEKGLRLFQDFNYLYVLSNDLDIVNVADKEYENVQIYIPDATTADPISIGAYQDDENRNYILRLNSDIEVSSMSQINKEMIGNKLRIFSFDKIKNSLSYNANSGLFSIGNGYDLIDLTINGNNTTDKIKYYYNNYDNPYLVSELQESITSSDVMLTFSFEDFDYELFTPNRRYFFNFLESDNRMQYNGRYKLSQNVAIFNSSGGEFFDYHGFCSFKISN